jgi:hypothetical protein
MLIRRCPLRTVMVLLAFASPCLLVGCNNKPELRPALRAGISPRVPLKIMVDGQEVARDDPYGQPPKFLPNEIAIDKVVDCIEVQVYILTPDGWTNEYSKIEPGALSGDCCCWVRLAPFDPQWYDFFVDNLKRPASVVECGELPMSVSADWKGKLSFPAPTKAASAMVRLDGKEIGALPPVAKDKQPNSSEGAWLLDTSGQKTYQCRDIVYRYAGAPNEDKGPPPVDPAEPMPTKLHAKILHALPRLPDYFLEFAPQLAFVTKGTKLEVTIIDEEGR